MTRILIQALIKGRALRLEIVIDTRFITCCLAAILIVLAIPLLKPLCQFLDHLRSLRQIH